MPSQKPLERAKANFNQGNELKEQGMVAESISSYQKAIQIKPDYTQPLLKLAAIYEEQENWTEATKCYQRIIGFKPENHGAYLKLAKALKQQNKIYGAISAYQQAIELNPDLPARVYKEYGDLLLQKQNTTASATAQRQAEA